MCPHVVPPPPRPPPRTRRRYGSFVEETIRTTGGWNEHSVNDRAMPLLPHIDAPHARDIDAALWQWVDHDLLERMQFPGPMPGKAE